MPKNRAVTINRNVFIKKIVSDEILFYQVITQFEFKLYIADRNYQEFIQLQKDLSLNDSDSSKLLINITELPSPTFDQRKFIESLEKYLQTIIQNISSINYIVLNFLNVSPEDQIPFLKFQESMIKNKCSILMQPKKKRNLRISRQSSTTSKDEYLSKNTSPARIISIFDITCTKWWKMLEGENQLVMFEFQLINYNKKGVQVWNIQKQYSDIKNFHTELEKQIRKEINLFNGMVPRASNISLLSDEFLEKRRKGLEKYMQSILSNKHFYCNVLYEFLEFDPENDRPISLENEPENNNVSQYKGNDLKIDAFNFVVEQEDASEVLLLDLSRATPRHLKAIKHQQSQFNDSMSPYFRSIKFNKS